MTHPRIAVLGSLVFGLLPALAAAQTDTPAVAFGTRHAVALRNNGDVLTWGHNVGCQLGRRGGIASAVPGLVMRNAKAIAAASDHVLVLTTEGTIYGWGTNGEGPLGTGTLYDACEGPMPAASVSGITMTHIATGYGFSLAVSSDGDLYCTGDNSMGQCPVPSSPGRLATFTRVPIPQIAGKVAGVAAGAFHALVLLNDGTVYAFGRGREGQLGDGRGANGAGFVTGLSGIVALAAGTWHSAALGRDGTVWLWGANQKSQLCDGTTVNRARPAALDVWPGGAATTIAAGAHATLVRTADGAVYACGDNQFGALGADRPPIVPRPALVTRASRAAGLAIGGGNGALSPDGCAVRLSGDNDFGIVSNSGNTAAVPFTARPDLSLCAPRPAAPLATIVNPAPTGGKSGCWTPRVQEDAVASPKFAPLRDGMLAAEDLLRGNAAFMAPVVPARFRTTIAAGPSDGSARLHVKVAPERKDDGTRLWTGECGVIPQIDRIGGAIFQVSVFFNVDARNALLTSAGTVPKQTGTVAGYPEFDGYWVLITRDGRLPWVPLTLADKLDAEGERRKKALADWNASRASMKSPDPAAQQKMYEAIRKTDPAGAEKLLADLKAQAEELARLQRDVYPGTTAAFEKAIADYEAYRASFTPQELAAPAVWGDPTGAGRRQLDAEIAALQRLSPEEQQQYDAFSRARKGAEARLVRQRHLERVSPLITGASSTYDLTNLRPGPPERAMGVKPNPSFPDMKDPNRIQIIGIAFWQDTDPRRADRRAWQQKVKDTFDFAALSALVK